MVHDRRNTPLRAQENLFPHMYAEQELHGTCHKTIVYAMLAADRYPQMHLVMLELLPSTKQQSAQRGYTMQHET